MIKKDCSSHNLQIENDLEKEQYFLFVSHRPQELLEVVHLGFVPASRLCPEQYLGDALRCVRWP